MTKQERVQRWAKAKAKAEWVQYKDGRLLNDDHAHIDAMTSMRIEVGQEIISNARKQYDEATESFIARRAAEILEEGDGKS